MNSHISYFQVTERIFSFSLSQDSVSLAFEYYYVNNNNIPSVIPKMGSGEGRMYIDLSPTVVG